MDLLDNILAGMAKSRPVLSEVDKEKKKKEQEERERQKVTKQQFVAKCEAALRKFKEQKEHPSLRYPPMPHFLRLAVHEVAEKLELVTHSFGVDDERFTMVYKQDTVPSDVEVAKIKARFKGEDPETAVKLSAEELNQRLEKEFAAKEEQLLASEKEAGVISKAAAKRKLAEMANEGGLKPLDVIRRDIESVEEVNRDMVIRRRQREEDQSGPATKRRKRSEEDQVHSAEGGEAKGADEEEEEEVLEERLPN